MTCVGLCELRLFVIVRDMGYGMCPLSISRLCTVRLRGGWSMVTGWRWPAGTAYTVREHRVHAARHSSVLARTVPVRSRGPRIPRTLVQYEG